VDPLNPNPEEDDLPVHKRSAQARRAAGAAAGGVGGGGAAPTGKAYMSPGDVLRHNAALAAAGKGPGTPAAAAGECVVCAR
jgi:hypothetical protein